MEIAQEKLDLHAAMHRAAGKLGYSCMPRPSSIDRGRWYAEINHVVTKDGSYLHTVPNVALGTGDTPLEAAANGYATILPEMGLYPFLAGVEALLPKLRRRADAMKKLDYAVADLTDHVRSANVPRAADPGEDDDL